MFTPGDRLRMQCRSRVCRRRWRLPGTACFRRYFLVPGRMIVAATPGAGQRPTPTDAAFRTGLLRHRTSRRGVAGRWLLAAVALVLVVVIVQGLAPPSTSSPVSATSAPPQVGHRWRAVPRRTDQPQRWALAGHLVKYHGYGAAGVLASVDNSRARSAGSGRPRCRTRGLMLIRARRPAQPGTVRFYPTFAVMARW